MTTVTATAPAHEVEQRVMPGGLRLIILPLPHLHTATVSVHVKLGSRDESPGDNGLSHFLEHMLFRGSKHYPTSHDLNLAMEELGGTLYAATEADATCFEVSLPPSKTAAGIAILGDLLTSPRFGELDVEKRIVEEEIIECLDEEGREVDADNLGRELLFGDHGLGRPITGRLENLASFDEAALRRHMSNHYVGNKMVVCAAGDVDPHEVETAVAKAFACLPHGHGVATVAPPCVPEGPRFRHVRSKGSQTEVRICFVSLGRRDPRHPALSLLGRIIDDGMSTRLHRRITEELGLAYDIYASLESYEDAGLFEIAAAVEHSKAPALIEQCLLLLDELGQQEVSTAELRKAKNRHAWDLEASLDDCRAMCARCTDTVLYDTQLDLNAELAAIDLVDRDAIRQAAQAVLRLDAVAVTCVGMLDKSLQTEARQIVEGGQLNREAREIREARV